MINRDRKLKEIISFMHTDFIKIITGMRRVGKSYLLNEIFYRYLLSLDVCTENIIQIALDNEAYDELLDSNKLYDYIKKRIVNTNMYYVLIDEIQLVEGFEKKLSSLLQMKNVDIYVTGSNSKFLSTDIITEFRGRGINIHVNPLSFEEVYEYYKLNKEKYSLLLNGEFNEQNVYNLYSTYGGLPQVVLATEIDQKKTIINQLYNNIYVNDIIDRYKIRDVELLNKLIQILSSNIGNILNINRLFNIFKSNGININIRTIERYIKILNEVFLITKIKRIDYRLDKITKGYCKYYFSDIGIRNYIMNWNKPDNGFVLENIIANELLNRNFSFNVGQIFYSTTKDNKYVRKEAEIDFICKQDNFFMQSCYSLHDKETYQREIQAFKTLKNSFKKIIVTILPFYMGYDEFGIFSVSIYDFLLDRMKLKLKE